MSRLIDLTVGIGAVAVMLLAAAPASAADKETMPPSTPSHQTVPEAAPPGSGSSGEPLSDKLQRQGGVLRPPTGLDPDMAQRPPAEGKTPVIRPPGTPGGEEGVQPK